MRLLLVHANHTVATLLWRAPTCCQPTHNPLLLPAPAPPQTHLSNLSSWLLELDLHPVDARAVEGLIDGVVRGRAGCTVFL